MDQQQTILMIDDDERMTQILARLLGDDYRVYGACSGEEGLKRVQEMKPQLVLLDLNMPGMHGLSVLRRLRETDASLPVVMITAYGKVESAVQAMKLGASDYIEKPFRIEKMKDLLGELLSPRDVARTDLLGCRMVLGESPQMQAVWRLIRKFGPSDVTILLEGESGTGKELFARAIHALSKRSQGPFVPIDCAALPESMVESEIFGYEKGAFTGATERKTGRLEWANGGTLLLDEVSNIPLHMQGKLLRVIQELKLSRLGAKGPACVDLDIRIVAASNRSLSEMVQSGRFREDLYYRLSSVTLQLPPLREREGDIELLARHFLASSCAQYRRAGLTLAQDTLDCLTHYAWPGNVRELENAIQSAVLLAEDRILSQHLPAHIQASGSAAPPQRDARNGMRLEVGLNLNLAEHVDLKTFRGMVAEAAEKELLARMASQGRVNRSQLAERLHIDPKTLRSKLKKFGLDQ
ncbi:MAG: sigma-54-dependent Fis family transcriptional regulator [Nitrospinae bacterium]|nr:sigma-54-dependent Fis family transcriptional regulator [Nitrospinota bacterium]